MKNISKRVSVEKLEKQKVVTFFEERYFDGDRGLGNNFPKYLCNVLRLPLGLLARKTNKDKKTVKAWISGETKPTEESLKILAELYENVA